jgi:hypothetical protein
MVQNINKIRTSGKNGSSIAVFSTKNCVKLWENSYEHEVHNLVVQTDVMMYFTGDQFIFTRLDESNMTCTL